MEEQQQSGEAPVQYDIEAEAPASGSAFTPPETPATREAIERDPDDPTEEELASYSDGVRKRIDKVTWQRHQARREAQRAERDKEEVLRIAQAIAAENQQLKSRLEMGEKALVSSISSSATAELDAARKELREAHESFDAEQIVAAQEKLQRALFRAQQAEAFQQARARQATPEAAASASGVPAQTTAAPAVPQAPQVDPAAQRWQERNPWFGTDEEMTAFAIGLHNRLTREHGPAYATTQEYYGRIDARMRDKFPEHFGHAGAPEATSSPAPTVVAPANRSGPARRVTLTKRQVELARRLNVPLELYAKKLAELENPSHG